MMNKIFGKIQITVIATLLIIPLLFPDVYYLQIFSLILVFAIYSMSWNILTYSGQASLGHAAFLGIGAYSSVLLVKNLGFPPLLAIFIGPILAAVIGLALGIIVLRLREWFLAMVTFGFSLIVQAIIVDDRLRFLTDGWNGIFAKPLVSYTSNYQFINYYIIAAVAIGVYIITLIIYNSKLGYALKAIDENEALAKISGINTTFYKVFAFVISTYLAGVAGALYVHGITLFVSPEIFSVQNSFWPLIFTLAGGLKTSEGPILGAFVIWMIWIQLSSFAGYLALLGIGCILAIIIIFAPKGLLELFSRIANIIRGRQI
ncbi:MAG: branched-chain amino acid ABC transporter permease [Thermoproteota archaeon]|jgi:branched-chain amino acid transport system permease protein|nr:branched-chain amino acid ABC transporter permease [Thermoproteota archaeon]